MGQFGNLKMSVDEINATMFKSHQLLSKSIKIHHWLKNNFRIFKLTNFQI